MNLSKEELLEKAKRDYPVGTKVFCLQGWCKDRETGIISDGEYTCEGEDEDKVWVEGSYYRLCIFNGGQWAEILPEESKLRCKINS